MSRLSARPTVLVTGGSIAGPAQAWALTRAGYHVTLLERAPAPREAGQNVDVRDAGRDVLRAMGVEDRVAAHVTGEVGTRFLDRHGRAYAEFPALPGHDGPTAEIEILRGELSRMLCGLTEGEAEQRYGDHVVAVEDSGDGVTVTLAGGRTERYDLLVVAEGRNSHTRDLVFGDQVRKASREQYIAYGTIPRTEADDDWWRWLTATDHRMVSLRPDNVGTIRANLGFLSPDLGLDRLDHAAQMAVLQARFAGVGWETDRVLEGFAAAPDEFYLERTDRVLLPRYSRGRVIVVGDAAWAGGPTGMGTTLALVGAYVLGGELADSGGDHRQAFARYEQAMRPYAEKVQNVPAAVVKAVLPGGPFGLGVVRTAHRIAATRLARSLVENRLLSREGRAFTLPRYCVFDTAPREPVSA